MLTVMALEGGVSSAIVSALTSAASEMTTTINSIVPVALGVVTTLLVVTVGMKAFKKITGR